MQRTPKSTALIFIGSQQNCLFHQLYLFDVGLDKDGQVDPS